MKALILMTRVNIPGRTKTRLMKMLSGEECARLHRCFLLDLFNVFEIIKDDIDIYLTYTPIDCFNILEDIVPSYIKCFPQEGKNLGEKMLNAFSYLLDKGYEKVSLMGSDVPSIQAQDILSSFEALDKSDISLGPTLDGGYYLIGMKKTHKELFEEKLKWGNKSVLEGTIDIANNLNLKIELIKKLRDIDTKEDLIAFKKEAEGMDESLEKIPCNTMDYINNLWSDKYYVKGYFEG